MSFVRFAIPLGLFRPLGRCSGVSYRPLIAMAPGSNRMKPEISLSSRPA